MSEASNTPKTPPRRIELKFCPVCGRHDRFSPFTGASHYTSGKKCPGKPLVFFYDVAFFTEQAGERSSPFPKPTMVEVNSGL